MIKPTIGRVVWFHGETNYAGFVNHDKTGPKAAIVTHVWSDRMVNLALFDSNGTSYPMTSVTLVQPDAPAPEFGIYCTWMPYQIGQAAKHEGQTAGDGNSNLDRVKRELANLENAVRSTEIKAD